MLEVGDTVYTHDGKEGTIIRSYIINSTSGPTKIYYTDIKNNVSANTAYLTEEFAAHISHLIDEKEFNKKREKYRKLFIHD